MDQLTRYLGAIVRDHHVLAIKQRFHDTGHAFWFLPGGRMESGESEEQCVLREMKEETNLDVRVARLLFEEPGHGGSYTRHCVFLCHPIGGEASPGEDPEYEAGEKGILEVGWFDLRDESGWEPDAKNDAITYRFLTLVREKMGYLQRDRAARTIRYEGAIVRDHHVLLIKHREHASGKEYWLFPGGGLEPGETEEECVLREMKEETNLDVTVTRLLLDEPEYAPGSTYERRRTYLCEPLRGDAMPGYEPEASESSSYGIVEVAWFNLYDDGTWDPLLVNDAVSYKKLQGVRRELGYLVE